MLKTVNLEEGMPLVDAAIRRATFELKSGRRMGLTAIKFTPLSTMICSSMEMESSSW